VEGRDVSMVAHLPGMKDPASPHLRSECAISPAWAQATVTESSDAWQEYADDYTASVATRF